MTESRKGRPPTMRMEVMAALEAHQHAPADAEMLSKITGRPVGGIRDLMFEYKRDGKVFAVNYHHHLWYFASAEARDAWVKDHPEGMPRQYVHTPRKEGPNARRPRVLEAVQKAGVHGITVLRIEQATKITQGNVRIQLYKMERDGIVWRTGGNHCMVWFAEKDWALAADAKAEERKREFLARSQEDKENKLRKKKEAAEKKFSKPLEKKRRTCSSKNEYVRPASYWQEKPKPIAHDVIWPSDVKVTIAPKHTDMRFAPDQNHVGEFSALGAGRYLE